MKNKSMGKYYPAALILYLNYFIHGVGCSVLGQAVIKEALSASWGVEAMSITAISAALGLGRLIALPFAGPFSDKLGRKISVMIGGASYAIYLIGLALAFNAGTNGGYQIAYVCAIMGGIANSFLDTGIYPAVAEIIYQAPGVATMGIKFFISISQMLLPFFLGAAVTTTVAGATSYNPLFYVCGIAYIVLVVLIFLVPLPDTDTAAGAKKEGLIESLKKTHFSIESIAMILVGFTCTGTFQLWLNCAQNFAKNVVGWEDPSIMQTYYSMGTLIALVVTALLTRKIKDVRFILVYPAVCLATLIVVLVGQTQALCVAGAFIIGWAGAGGLLQIATSVCNMLFPKIKGTVTALVMIASSLCNYTILTAASTMTPSGVMTMNIVLTAVGVLLGLFVNLRYGKLMAAAQED
jgi:MFS family permease